MGAGFECCALRRCISCYGVRVVFVLWSCNYLGQLVRELYSFLTVFARHFLFPLRANICLKIWLHYRKLIGYPIELSAELVWVEDNIAIRYKQWI